MIAEKQTFLGAGSPPVLPYDSEVEYLESTGTQWIDTEFVATGGCIIECSFCALESGALKVIAGSHSKSSANYYNRNQIIINDVRIVDFNKCEKYGGFGTSADMIGYFHEYYFNSISHNRIGKVDGVDLVSETTSGVLSPDTNVVLLMNQYDNSKTSGRIAWCRIYDSNSILVRDFISVRKNGFGYMYDRVTRRLFGNAGTGEFVVGPDVVEVEYIETQPKSVSDRQYIDTGVPSKTGLSADVRFMWLSNSIGYDNYILAQTGNTRMYFGTYQSKWMFGYHNYWQTEGIQEEVIYNANVVWESGTPHLDVDGSRLITGSDSETISNNGTMLVFSRQTNHAAFSAHARLYSLKMYDGDTLVRDYIPVRVGSDGALMDRLTRKIYRNSGAGSFIIGPMKNKWKNPYVTDGLLAMWDGEWNVAGGVHDPNPTTWKDLVGNGYDLDIYGSVEPNCVRTTNTCAAGMSGTISGISTIECCCKISPSLSSPQMLLAYSGPTDTTNLGLVQYGPSVGYQCFSNIFWDYPLIATEAARTVAATTSACYVDGVGLQSVSHSADQWNNQSYTGIGGRHWQNHSWRGAGDYYCVRFYNRALTPAEIANNYAIDKKRFWQKKKKCTKNCFSGLSPAILPE